jgi:hypothetical protein
MTEEEKQQSMDMTTEDVDTVAVSMLLQKINRILAENEKIIVSIASSGIAECDIRKNRIFINFSRLKGMSKTLEDYLVLVKGVDYHELGHILYTDMDSEKISAYYSEYYAKNGRNVSFSYSEYFDVINLLEDCRMENLFSSVYDRAKFYFSFAAIEILLKRAYTSDSYNLSNYLLLYGRKFLNVDLKDYKKRVLSMHTITPAIVNEGEQLVNAFIFEVDINKKLDIGIKLAILLNKANQKTNNLSDNGSLSSKLGKKGVRDKNIAEAVKKLKEKLENGEFNLDSESENSEESESKENEDSQESKHCKSGKNSSEKKASKKSSRKISDGDKDDEYDEEDGDYEDEGDDEEDGDKFDNNMTTTKQLLDKLKETITDNLENIQNEIARDVDTINAAIGKDEFCQLDGEMFNPTEQERAESRKVQQVLRILRGDLSASVRKFQKSGSLDIQSAMRAEKMDTMNIFRRVRLNVVDKSKLGVAVLLDSSSSVRNSEFRDELKATWVLSNALESVKGRVEVIEFSDYNKVIKGFNSSGDWKRHYDGGTQVSPALKVARLDLLKLKQKERVNNLIVFIVSDGAFNDYNEAKDTIDKLRKDGIKVVWILANRYQSNYRTDDIRKHLDAYIHIYELGLLSKELQKFVLDLQKDINKKLQRGAN